MDTGADGLLDFVARHHDWAPWVIFALAAGETTAFVSFFVLATPVLVGVGALVSAGALHFLPIWSGAAAGALAGSTFSWWVGHRFGRAVLSAGPVTRHPVPVARALLAFARWGVLAVFIAHVFAPLTSVVFLIAGVAAIPFWRFQLANVPGALLWAWFMPKAGELGGDVGLYLWKALTGA